MGLYRGPLMRPCSLCSMYRNHFMQKIIWSCFSDPLHRDTSSKIDAVLERLCSLAKAIVRQAEIYFWTMLMPMFDLPMASLVTFVVCVCIFILNISGFYLIRFNSTTLKNWMKVALFIPAIVTTGKKVKISTFPFENHSGLWQWTIFNF